MNDKSLVSILDRSWRKYSDNDALQIDDNVYSYHQLFSAASNIANQITKLGIKNQSILVLSKKTFVGYVNIISSFMSQNTYVPLNYSYPVIKNCEIIRQSLVTTLIVDPSCIEELIPIIDHFDCSLHIIVIDITPSDFESNLWPEYQFDFLSTEEHSLASFDLKTEQQRIAYLLFTSGSTGTPKGVPISENNLLSYLSNIHQVFDFCETDRHSQFFEFTFDLSIHDLFVCWSSGGCLVAAKEFAKLMPLHFAQRNKLTVWFSVPSLVASAQTILNKKFNEFKLPDLRYSLFCGEALPTRLAKDWAKVAFHSTIDNLYGPTEATIAFTHFRCEELDSLKLPVVSIGRAFGANKALILDKSLELTSQGEYGDLYLSGHQLAQGYWRDKKNTASNFKTIVLNGEETIIYKSGDLVSEDIFGSIHYHGRVDQQVQIRGYRVELQEIEYTIQCAIPKYQVVVIPFPLSEEGEALGLIAYHTSSRVQKEELQRAVADKLPDYMRPSNYYFLDKIPVNTNGKVDRKKLHQITEVDKLEESHA